MNGCDTSLGQKMAYYKKEHRLPLKDLTVLSAQNDPYRLDTPAKHRDAQWLADTMAELDINPERIHLRGLHYMLVGRADLPKWKGGGQYTNTDDNWLWLSGNVVKSARWLGYLEWSMFEDQRNSQPEIYREGNVSPYIGVTVADVEIYLPNNLEPRPVVYGDFYRQPYQFVLIAEKAGVGNLLRPLAEKVEGEMILPTGEISDTLIYEMLVRADEDGRPLVVFSLGDFDPAGHQMAISIGRKVQAMTDTLFDLDVMVFAPGLTLEQCKEWGLPSTPLKATEKRGDSWVARWGWEQTELDAAVALAPDEFSESVWQAIQVFWDADLLRKNTLARVDAREVASQKIDEFISEGELICLREKVEDKLSDLEDEVAQINEALNIDVPYLTAPDQELGEVEGSGGWLQSTEDWLQSTDRMRERKGKA